ncbi:CDP-glucose 4,6-dehydratase [Paenibacillus sp. 598K]|uniref:CDP-glucose 4,6-dehydratase n=1 Tax=Paenibacillus sp. 598K TaxID=1117987 RepID=UPI000FF9761B|nr:CDP-glucose 4,6-dehydratase [Paenibacillus sp. 598K]GBF72228.1 CDP-glucose 4,6-dehydratase [Paenibacillus sp. 598K]
MRPTFWHNRRVLLTGHTGFKGAWLALWLRSMGAQVSGYARRPETSPNLHDYIGEHPADASDIGELSDIERLTDRMRVCAPEVVLHLAAQPLVRLSYDEPLSTLETNVLGTAHLLEAVRRTDGGCRRAVVVVTTDKCYSNREWEWGYRETDQLGGHDPYSASKACAEVVTDSYRSAYFAPSRYAQHQTAIATARAGNVLGGGDWSPDRLVPDALAALADARPLAVRAPEAVRPWQHVLEPLHGYLMLAERLHEEGPVYGEAWNFGPEEADARPVSWVLERLAAIWGAELRMTMPGEREKESSGSKHEAGMLRLDCSKARSRLGWRPRWTLEQALAHTVRWEQARRGGAAMTDITLGQIRAYTGEEVLL